jgi:hypothetical protein
MTDLVARLEALKKYVRHLDHCGYVFDQQTQTGELTNECTCGRDTLLADYAKAGMQEPGLEESFKMVFRALWKEHDKGNLKDDETYEINNAMVRWVKDRGLFAPHWNPSKTDWDESSIQSRPAPAAADGLRDIAGEVWDLLLPHLPLGNRTALYDEMREKFPMAALGPRKEDEG